MSLTTSTCTKFTFDVWFLSLSVCVVYFITLFDTVVVVDVYFLFLLSLSIFVSVKISSVRLFVMLMRRDRFVPKSSFNANLTFANDFARAAMNSIAHSVDAVKWWNFWLFYASFCFLRSTVSLYRYQWNVCGALFRLLKFLCCFVVELFVLFSSFCFFFFENSFFFVYLGALLTLYRILISQWQLKKLFFRFEWNMRWSGI